MNMMRNELQQSFTVYRWHNPQTSSDYPFLAVAEDRAMLLSLGNFGLAFDWTIPDEAAELLASDFAPTGQVLSVNLGAVRAVLDETFLYGTESGSVTFDAKLRPIRLQVVLGEPEPPSPDVQLEDDRGPEYAIEGFGSYLRLERAEDKYVPVTMMERAMLDTCIATFAELAGQGTACAALLAEPPPPRYRAVAERERAAAERTAIDS